MHHYWNEIWDFRVGSREQGLFFTPFVMNAASLDSNRYNFSMFALIPVRAAPQPLALRWNGSCWSRPGRGEGST